MRMTYPVTRPIEIGIVDVACTTECSMYTFMVGIEGMVKVVLTGAFP